MAEWLGEWFTGSKVRVVGDGGVGSERRNGHIMAQQEHYDKWGLPLRPALSQPVRPQQGGLADDGKRF